MTNSRTPSPPGSNEMKPATVAKQTHANVKGKSEKVISVPPIPYSTNHRLNPFKHHPIVITPQPNAIVGKVSPPRS